MAGTVEFRVLGPVEVVLDGRALRIGSPVQRTLLALLLARPNELVTTDRIVDVFWPDEPPEARRKLWFHVSKLRSILEQGSADGDELLVTRPTGYLLRVEAHQLDAARFERLTRAAHAALADDPAHAAETLRTALALWRGEPFEDVLHEDALAIEAARLNELRLAALEERVEADLALGRNMASIPDLEALVAEHPYREHLRAQLMLALYRTGRQSDALAAYRVARRTLVEELGLEPSNELKSLEHRILTHDPALSQVPAGARRTERREARKLVTVLFVELTDLPAGSGRRDPEDVRAFFLPYQTHIRAEIERFGGTVETFIGDAVVAVFGAPLAHEDDPERAVRAALTIRDWLAEHGDGVQVRIGVATGEALVTLGGRVPEGEPLAVGEVVNTAARLQAVASTSQVLVGDQTFRASTHAIEYREAGALATSETGIWIAVRPRGQPRTDVLRHRSPFVGRERELDALLESLGAVASDRSPQLVTILGAAGIGKTRLVSELHEEAVEPVTWREGRSLPYGDGVSFWALREMVKAQAAILESDLPEIVERKLRTMVERLIDDPDEARRTAGSLGALTGLNGEDSRAAGNGRTETSAGWRRFIEAIAGERLLVLVFEDTHWADEALLDFIEGLTDEVGGVPLLVVATARPELFDRRPNWAGGRSLTISLPPLSDEETAGLVAALLDHQARDDEVRKVLARVGGNPLYAEQFCRILVEGGRLEELPETVHGTIAARLDLLAVDEKRLLQDAAVIGKVFWAGALEAVGGHPRGDADDLLERLARRGFIQRSRPSSVAGDVEYTFAHELLREVAYGEIPRATRAERHRSAADWIETLGRLEDHAELLAHHYVAALDSLRDPADADLLERSVDALFRAGLRAMRLSANERAVEHFTRAIGLVERLPEGHERDAVEAELQLQLGTALFALQGFSAPGVERAYGRTTELMMASAPSTEQFPLQFGLSIFHGHRGNFDQSMQLVERMSALAAQGDETLRLQALHAGWMNSLFGGRLDDAVAAAHEGRAIYRPSAHHATSFLYANHDPGVCGLALQALAFAYRGESVRAVTQMHEAIALAEALGHAVTLAQPMTQLPWALQINGDVDATLVAADRALALEGEIIHPQFFGIAHAMRGWALERLGEDATGVAELERAFADELHASHIWAVMIGALLAEVHLARGRCDAARSLLDQVRALTSSMAPSVFEPDVLRVEGELLAATGHEAEGKERLRHAVATAEEHGALALALRAGLELVRSASAGEADRDLVRTLCQRLPAENDTDYRRRAESLVSR